MNKKIACLATMPDRTKQLSNTLQSLLFQDIPLDLIAVYHNDPFSIKKLPEHLKNDSKIIHLSSPLGDIKDMGKFFPFYSLLKKHKDAKILDKVLDEKTYFFSCDDDLIYPTNYTKKHLEHLDSYSSCLMTSFHGAIITGNVNRYHQDAIKMKFHCLQNVKQSVSVNVPGSGVSAFKVTPFLKDILKTSKSEFIDNVYIADLWLAYKCQKHRIPIVVLPHLFNYFSLQKTKTTIYEDRINTKQTKEVQLINQITWGIFFPETLRNKDGE